MSKFRIRCSGCHKNFCSGCSAEPYHLGKTCEQHKEFKEARKCRFCETKLTQPPPSMVPAFRDVCRKSECIDLMNQCCDKMLQCGHACQGFKGEPKCLPCLNPECVEKNPSLTLDQNCDEFCTICYTGSLA
jgi:hypothetical protein